MVITVRVKDKDGKWRSERALVDSGAEANCISQTLAIECGYESLEELREGMSTINGEEIYTYGIHDINIETTDSESTTKSFRHPFVAIDFDVRGVDLVLGYPWLASMNPDIQFSTNEWKYRTLTGIEIATATEFEKELKETVAGCLVYKYQQDHLVLGVMSSNPGRNPSDPIPGLPQKWNDYQDVFDTQAASSIPEHHAMEHAIELEEGKTPPWQPVYNLSEPELEELRKYLEEATNLGRIRRSTSPAGAPILFVPKKGGGLRLCVDYRGLNQITVKNRTPLPLISETLDRLRRAKRFTKLDLKDAYHRIRVKKGDEWKTAFRTRYGHFEYLVMPFGLANAPATFQAYINQALVGLVDVTCVVYLDDILVFSEDVNEHDSAVKEVLERLRTHKLYANLKKCQFDIEQVEFLGYIINSQGISMDPVRVEAVASWPIPKSIRDIQVFLGFANFYRRFIERYSDVSRGLTDMLQGANTKQATFPFQLTEQALRSFILLKRRFTRAPLLRHFDPTLPIKTETDASAFAVAGVISQLFGTGSDKKWHPIAFYSRKLSPSEKNYQTHDSELLAIVLAFKHWSHYLRSASSPITVRTDHDNLKYFMITKKLNGRQARWAEDLAAYDFVIEHRPGRLNPADGPSRRPDYRSKDDPEMDYVLPTLLAKLRKAPRSVIGALSVANRGRQTDHSLLSRRPRKPSTGDEPGLSDRTRIDLETAYEVHSTCKSHGPTEAWRSAMDLVLKPATGAVGCKQRVPRVLATGIVGPGTAYSLPSESMREALIKLQQEDAFVTGGKLAEMMNRDRNAGSSDRVWRFQDGLLLRKGKAYVPRESALRQEILAMCHDDPYSGHFGAKRTQELVARHYFWQELRDDVRDYVNSCAICQRTKAKRHRTHGELAPLPVPSGPWQEITMDFITGLPPTKWRNQVFDSILVVVDRFTKVARYIPVRKDITAPELADVFMNTIFKDYGVPAGIVSDRGPQFTSEFWGTFMFYLKVRRRLSTAFHPQTDGQTERQNQVLEHYLRTYCNYRQNDWGSKLPMAEFAYNNSTHDSTGMPPFQALYGFCPSMTINAGDSVPEGRKAATAWERIQIIQEERETLMNHLRNASESQKKYYDQKHKPVHFKIGQEVMLSAKNIKQLRPSRKLSDKYLGPFKVKEVIGKQAYKLALTPGLSRIHDVFHVSLLEPYNKRAGVVRDPGPMEVEGNDEWEVKAILAHRDTNKKLGRGYLVRWKGYSPEHDTWEPTSHLENAQESIKAYLETEPGHIEAKRGANSKASRGRGRARGKGSSHKRKK
jgi:hypothetical protein